MRTVGGEMEGEGCSSSEVQTAEGKGNGSPEGEMGDEYKRGVGAGLVVAWGGGGFSSQVV